MNSADTPRIPRCLYILRRECIVFKRLLDKEEYEKLLEDWGSPDWVKLHCAMCVKAMYAKAKFKAVNRYSVVNTL